MRSIVFLFMAASLLIAAAPPEGRKDPQSSYEPKSGPGVGQELLAKFAGHWDVVKSFYPKGGGTVRTEGECRQAMIHDGRFLRSEFLFRHGDKTSTGLGLIGFEPESGTFTSVWTDSRQARMSFRRSRDPFDGRSIVLFSDALEGAGDNARRSKTVTRLEEGGRTLVHRQYALGADGEERLMMELVMTRKAKADTPGPD